jgi:hypothetical protein
MAGKAKSALVGILLLGGLGALAFVAIKGLSWFIDHLQANSTDKLWWVILGYLACANIVDVIKKKEEHPEKVIDLDDFGFVILLAAIGFLYLIIYLGTMVFDWFRQVLAPGVYNGICNGTSIFILAILVIGMFIFRPAAGTDDSDDYHASRW